MRVFVPGAACLLGAAAGAAGSDVRLDVAVTMSVPHTSYIDVDEAHALSRGRAASPSSSALPAVSPALDADSGPAFAAFVPFIDVERPAQSSARHIVAWARRLRPVRGASQDPAPAAAAAATSLPDPDEARRADASVPRPGAEAGVAAGLDPGSAWLLVTGDQPAGKPAGVAVVPAATIDAEFRVPLHFRYQRPCRPGHAAASAAAARAHRACGTGWVALAAPRVFVRAGAAGSWTELALDEGSAESFRAAEMEGPQAERALPDSVGSAVQGHGGFATVPDGEFGADVLRAVPVGQTDAEALVRPVTVWAAWLAAAVVVAAIGVSVS